MDSLDFILTYQNPINFQNLQIFSVSISENLTLWPKECVNTNLNLTAQKEIPKESSSSSINVSELQGIPGCSANRCKSCFYRMFNHVGMTKFVIQIFIKPVYCLLQLQLLHQFWIPIPDEKSEKIPIYLERWRVGPLA